MGEPRVKAADEFHSAILERLTSEKRIHAETAVASAARMAGTFMLRSLGLPLGDFEPGSLLFSEGTDEKGPALVFRLKSTLEILHVAVDPSGGKAVEANAVAPLLSLLETQELLEAPLTALREKYQLTYWEAAEAGAMAAALLVRDTSSLLGADAAFNIAVQGFVEGSKTVPFRGPTAAPGT
jgi:hypothetical protein